MSLTKAVCNTPQQAVMLDLEPYYYVRYHYAGSVAWLRQQLEKSKPDTVDEFLDMFAGFAKKRFDGEGAVKRTAYCRSTVKLLPRHYVLFRAFGSVKWLRKQLDEMNITDEQILKFFENRPIKSDDARKYVEDLRNGIR